MDIELHRLDMKYAHTRIMNQVRIRRLADSIHKYGQVEPMTVIQTDDVFVLVDGYKRTAALKYLGRDTGNIHLLADSEDEGLFQLMINNSNRPMEAIEEACIIQELHVCFHCSLGEIGRRTGRDKSFVKRRLDLVQVLPEEILKLVMKGSISTWAAERVLVPLAGANASDAIKLASYLEKEPVSTRQLRLFYEHYKTSNRQVRRRMIDAPDLFFKSVEAVHSSNNEGPEEKWIRDANTVCGIIQRLHDKVPEVFYAEQEKRLRNRLLVRAARVRRMSLELRDRIRECLKDDRSDNRTAHKGTA